MNPYQILLERSCDSADKLAFITRQGKEVDFSQLKRRVCSLAAGLSELGLQKGEVVACLLPNCIEFVEVYLACAAIGCVFQPTDFRFQGEELKNTLLKSDVKLLFCHASRIDERTEPFIPEGVKRVVVGGEREGWLKYSSLFLDCEREIEPPKINEEKDIALFLYTSGSTGSIKCVPVTFRQLDFFPADLEAVWGRELFDRGVSLLPMSHISGPIVINTCLSWGTSYVISDTFMPDVVIQLIKKYEVTWTHTVPSIAGMLLKAQPQKHNLRSVKMIALMGTNVPASMLRRLEQAFPGAIAIQGYGLTETSPLLTLQTPQTYKKKRASIGKALKGVEIKLVDSNGREVPVGVSGEIVVRGPRVFSGYFGNPEATQKAFRGGWFHTGDVAKVDQEGCFYHLGRLDDLIVTGGLNVYPGEVEQAACSFPAVKEAVAYGVPDPERGQALHLDVVAWEDADLDPDRLRLFLSSQLASYKIPRRIKVVQSIPRTPTGKPIRKRSS